MDDLIEFWHKWREKGFKPTNLSWLTDWSVTGVIGTNGHKPQAIPQGVSAAQSWLQKRQAQNG